MVNFSISDDGASILNGCPGLLGGDDLSYNDDTRPTHPQPWCGQHLSNGDGVNKNFYNYTNQDDKEKTPMCRIAELARYHKMKYKYKLMDESGPAHKKLFTVQLVMSPDQNNQVIYEGSGASIKKAQQAAASEALRITSLSVPPEKTLKKKRDAPTAVQLLLQMTRRMHTQEPVYRMFPKQRYPNPRMPFVPPMPVMFPSMPPSTAGPPPMIPYIPPMRTISGTPPMLMSLPDFDKGCMVSVMLYPGKVFTGCGSNYNAAKEQAAAQALMFLAPTLQQMGSPEGPARFQRKVPDSPPVAEQPASPDSVEMGNSSPEGEMPKHRQKSIISHVHEAALQMKLNVQFEVLMEEGPPHERTYIVKCSLLNCHHEVVVEDTGNGRKKKEATQAACFNVLNKLRSLESSPLYLATNLLKSHRRNSSHPKEPKKKTIVKDMKMDPSYGHQINPVSRLIQVLQARGEPEPTFNLVGEHGQSRYKEFVMEVSCGERYCTGNGPNKRLAKRAAAEAMLAEIGYVKPLPAPGKSLLKKRNDPMVNIGVFDLSEMKLEMAAVEEKKGDSLSWDLSVDAPSPTDSTLSSGHDSPNDGAVPQSPGSKRRVTFNSQVKACPPPEDANYPQPEVTPLKADVVVEGKLKRLRKAKEGKRKLTEDQQEEVTEFSKQFLSNLSSGMFEGVESVSRRHLEGFSEKYKFSVQFTNFPKSPDGNDQTYFALVSLGLEKPLVCHGSGMTIEGAADNAAFNAICSLAKLNEPQMSPVPQQ